MIADLKTPGDPLAKEFEKAAPARRSALEMARKCGDYPLLSGGDVNLYSLFVERATQLCKPDGVVGLLVPSGLATEVVSQKFFLDKLSKRSIKCVYDFFNKRADATLFFPDVYYRFKFSVVILSPKRTFGESRFATFVRDLSEIQQEGFTYTLTEADLEKVNPITKTAPIYRCSKDKVLAGAIYTQNRTLIARRLAQETKIWPVKYSTMYHMANDSRFFRTRGQLEEQEGAYPIGGHVWKSPAGTWVPLYEGKMVQAFDHRASSITTVQKNLYRPGQGTITTPDQHKDPGFSPASRYFVLATENMSHEIVVKDVTATTNLKRFVISCVIPPFAAGHTLPFIRMQIEHPEEKARAQALLCANLNCIILDYIARTKILSNHVSWFILEQLPAHWARGRYPVE